MTDINSLTLSGHLGADPKLNEKRDRLKLRIASNRYHKDGERTVWFTVLVLGQRAPKLAEMLKKGDYVVATGILEQLNWTTDDGKAASAYQMLSRDLNWSRKAAEK